MRRLDTDEEQFVVAGFAENLAAVFSPNGRMLATSAASSNVQLWDAHSGVLIASVDDTLVSDEYQILSTELRSELELFDEKAFQDDWKNKRVPRSTKNYALRFQEGFIRSPALLYSGDHPITLEAWVRPTDLSGHKDIIGNPETGGVFLAINNGKGGFGIHLGPGFGYQVVTSNTVVDVERPFHIAGVFDGAHVKLFIDGILQNHGLDLNGNHKASTLPLTIGANPGNSYSAINFFSGVIDEVRVSKVARYVEDFTPEFRFAPDENTMALYHFDEGHGKIVHDVSMNGNHGLIQNATWVNGIASETMLKNKQKEE